MNSLKRGDIFSLNHNGLSYIGFVRKSGKYFNLVLFDDESQSLKTLSHVSPSVLKYSILSKNDMPNPLKKAYSDCFFRIKKGTVVEFDSNDNTYTGLVVKGGLKIKVEVYLDGKLFYSIGPAHAYRIKN